MKAKYIGETRAFADDFILDNGEVYELEMPKISVIIGNKEYATFEELFADWEFEK